MDNPSISLRLDSHLDLDINDKIKLAIILLRIITGSLLCSTLVILVKIINFIVINNCSNYITSYIVCMLNTKKHH